VHFRANNSSLWKAASIPGGYKAFSIKALRGSEA
jgi:hypothetical protein